MKPTVFIHTNHKQLLGAKVAAYALSAASSAPDEFDVRLIELKDHPALHQRDGTPYLRHGRPVIWKNNDLQSFTPLRFLPPQLLNWRGRAIVLDPDIFAVADIRELLNRDTNGKAILARRVVPADGRPPYWTSSVMLLDCERLQHWQWEQQIEEMFALSRDYRPWINLELEPQDSIGELEEEWNHFDTLAPDTKLLHNTGRLTQPWKTGLPVDFVKDPQPPAKRTPRLLAGRAKAALVSLAKPRTTRPAAPAANVYQRHPDPRQEEFFFRLLHGALKDGHITAAEVEEAIELQYIRPDSMKLINR